MNERWLNRQRIGGNSSGFTILEVLIATLVFSTVLVLITIGVLRFGQAYYHDTVESQTQNTTRSVIESISQAIQFSSGASVSVAQSNGASRGFCIGSELYSYLPGYELVNGTPGQFQTNHALVVNAPLAGCDASTQAQDLLSSGTLQSGSHELLGDRMRLVTLSIKPLSGMLYSIDVRMAYGDNAVLCSSTASDDPASCNNNIPMPSTGDYQDSDLACVNGSNVQFCAVTELFTSVEKRLNQ